jgi:catechol 2,3-dioxygenase-like lactoylglutathione lyase family enzyme
MGHEFRFVYFTPRYEETIAFLRDSLGLPVAQAWEALDSDDHRGTVFAAGSGFIEVMENEALARGPSDTASGGPFAAVEVEDVDALHARVTAKGVPLHYPLADKPWGHRGFSVRDPNGVEIAFYGVIGG